LITVGDWVRVRTSGGSAAARKYAGREGQVTTITPGLDKVNVLVRIEGNRAFETAFEERDLVKVDDGGAVTINNFIHAQRARKLSREHSDVVGPEE
jgi:hypothetical protein